MKPIIWSNVLENRPNVFSYVGFVVQEADLSEELLKRFSGMSAEWQKENDMALEKARLEAREHFFVSKAQKLGLRARLG